MTVRIGGSNPAVNQLTEGQKNAIISGVFAMAQSISNGAQTAVAPGKASYETRQASYQKMLRKEAELTMALQTQAGLKKIAAKSYWSGV